MPVKTDGSETFVTSGPATRGNCRRSQISYLSCLIDKILGITFPGVPPTGCARTELASAQMVRRKLFLLSFEMKCFDKGWLASFKGWNGKHCTLEGCPKNCNGHGQCKTNHNLEWECWCESGWFGPGCDISLEQDCSDRKDNDEGTFETTLTIYPSQFSV